MKSSIIMFLAMGVFISLARKPKCKGCEKRGENTVCASDGKTWVNKYCMAGCSSVTNVRVVHEGRCEGSNRVHYSSKGAHQPYIHVHSNKNKFKMFNSCKYCNKFTDTTVVCGSDGVSWLNKYCMASCSSIDDVSIVHTGKCNENDEVIPEKYKRQTHEYDKDVSKECRGCEVYGNDIVCANDGVSWINEQCMLACSYIKEKVKILHKGTCKELNELFPYDKEDNKEKCKTCDKYGSKVVCGSDHNSWRNIHCMLYCSDRKNVQVLHPGWCKGQG